MVNKLGSWRRTDSDLAGGRSRIKLSKIGGPQGPQHSGPELLENLREQRLVRVAAGHANPYFSDSDLNQRSDFEYLEPDRAHLHRGEGRRSQSQAAETIQQRVGEH